MTDRIDDAPNEILVAAKQAKARREAAARTLADRTAHWPLGKIGLGVGIGSAAVAAAVIFANRSRPKK